jgi:regulator of CtrA degradation
VSVSSLNSVTVSFGERFAASGHFDEVFKDGMALVERTASYLDGQGRREAKSLNAGLAVIYANESMRLTSRLLEIASWLLLRRSHSTGDITSEDARVRRRCIKLNTIGRPSHVKGYAELPQALRKLIDDSFALNDRIVRLDRAMEACGATREVPETFNPVAVEMQKLQQAFGAAH